MYKKIGAVLGLLIQIGSLQGQHHWSLGGGYFGENITHPGIYLQAEYLNSNPKKLSFPIRGGIGYYLHHRSHQATIAEIAPSIRFHLSPKFYLGLGAGIGVMSSWYHSDLGVFDVDYQGEVKSVASFAGIDFMPSLNLDLGYNLRSNAKRDHSFWLRPKAFLQMPSNTGFIFHYGLVIGYAFHFKN